MAHRLQHVQKSISRKPTSRGLRRRSGIVPAIALAAVLVLAASGAGGAPVPPDPGAGLEPGGREPRPPLPPRVLWAWERPEDLRFLEPGRDAVAVLMATVEVPVEGTMRVRGRRNPLAVPEGLDRVAVTRIEVERGAPLDEARRPGLVRKMAAAIAATAGAGDALSPLAGVQVDFDARRSERGFYAALLDELRRRLGETPLTITALASWCLGDPWIAGLPIDDAIPMLFRMGIDERAVRGHLDGGGDFTLPVCRNSLGLSTDEPWPALPGGGAGDGGPRRRYLFHPRPWTADALAAVPTHPATAGGTAAEAGKDLDR